MSLIFSPMLSTWSGCGAIKRDCIMTRLSIRRISETSILQTFTGGAAEMTDSQEAAREKLRQDRLECI